MGRPTTKPHSNKRPRNPIAHLDSGAWRFSIDGWTVTGYGKWFKDPNGVSSYTPDKLPKRCRHSCPLEIVLVVGSLPPRV